MFPVRALSLGARWCAGVALGAALAMLPAAARSAPGAGPAPAAAVDPYEQALATARVEAAAGRFDEAAGVLSAAARSWPQDFPLQLERAWCLLRAGRYQAAADGYRAALELSPGSAEAHLGLDEALAGRGAPTQWWAGLYGAGTGWQGHPSRTSLAAATLALDAVLQDRFTLGLTYRGLVSPTAGGGRGRGSSAVLSSPTSEGHLALGLAAASWSLSLHGAATGRSAGTSAGVEQVYGLAGTGAGLSASLRLGLVWRAAAAWIAWEDQAGAQLEATAELPLGHHLSLQAGWRGQRLDGTVSGAALARVSFGGPWSLALRAEAGHQRRPWDLQGRALYGLPETLRGALRLEAAMPLAGRVRGWLGADLERWRLATAVDATATRLGAGLTLSF